MEPPVLVKLEKEIELEETLLNTSGPEDSISIPKSCCQHEELHEAVSNCHTFNYDGVSKSHSLPQMMLMCNRKCFLLKIDASALFKEHYFKGDLLLPLEEEEWM